MARLWLSMLNGENQTPAANVQEYRIISLAMIREIINEVREAIQEAFTYSLHTNSGSFVLFLARGDYDHRFEGDQFAHLEPKPSPIVLIIC